MKWIVFLLKFIFLLFRIRWRIPFFYLRAIPFFFTGNFFFIKNYYYFSSWGVEDDYIFHYIDSFFYSIPFESKSSKNNTFFFFLNFEDSDVEYCHSRVATRTTTREGINWRNWGGVDGKQSSSRVIWSRPRLRPTSQYPPPKPWLASSVFSPRCSFQQTLASPFRWPEKSVCVEPLRTRLFVNHSVLLLPLTSKEWAHLALGFFSSSLVPRVSEISCSTIFCWTWKLEVRVEFIRRVWDLNTRGTTWQDALAHEKRSSTASPKIRWRSCHSTIGEHGQR